jgi:hypothetical protein
MRQQFPVSISIMQADLEKLIGEFFAGDFEGDLEYEGDSYTPTSDNVVFIPDDRARDNAEAQLLQIGGPVVEPFVEYVSRNASQWNEPSNWDKRELPRAEALLSKLGQDPFAVPLLCKAIDRARGRARNILAAALSTIRDDRAVERLREYSEQQRRDEEWRQQREAEEQRRADARAEAMRAIAARDEAKRAEAARAEEAKRSYEHRIQLERASAGVCVLCGKPLGFFQKLFGPKQHKECTTFSPGQR